MESTLTALGGLLLKAIPTFVLVLVLHFYLKYVFFRPLQRVLDARYEATEGARKQAEQSLERAAAKAREYEEAMRAARAEVYQAQEDLHRRLEQQRREEAEAARGRAEAAIAHAKADLARDAEGARRTLASEADAIAARIADTILRGSAA